jgi:mono/diheme cytochrome c family protein
MQNTSKRSLYPSLLLLPALLLGAGLARGADSPKPAAVSAADADAYDKQVRPLLQQYCISCHGAKEPSAGINLTAYADVASIQRDQTTWRKVMTQIRGRSMPPARLPQPTIEQRDLMATWVGHTLNSAADDLLPKNPGRVLLHRLNRAEYNNTVRDLFGVTSNPADSFPADGGGGGGFDNNASTLFMPPILMERYLQVANDILSAARPARLFIARPSQTLPKRLAARKILAYWAMRGYRRPVEGAEMERLVSLYDAATKRGESFESATRFALKAVLVSPNFLFRAEQDHPVRDAYPINDYELASRLSYFLWSSMPDEELFQLAAQKRLHSPAVLDVQVTRMLRSPKAHAFADSFAGQWLKARDLYTSAKPDPNRFPGYTDSLRDAMYGETISFFQSVLQEDASLLRLIDADYTFVNEELAKHYGIEGVTGPQMRRVSLPDHRRGGVLTQASILTLTSYPQRTSPVLRGKWVLGELLGTPPPPPPPVVATLSPDDAPKDGLTFRQRLEQHRSKPECAGCHARMDPIGFGLENFDATGKWRQDIGGKPVDASGVLTTGEKFAGPIELKQRVLALKDDFARNLTEKMLAYALGRGLEPYDLPAVRKITATLAQNDYRSSLLIREIVKSYPFQYRKNDVTPPASGKEIAAK